MGNFTRNMVTLLLTLLFCLVFVEILSRVFFPAFNPSGKFVFYVNKQGVPLGPKNFSGRMWYAAGDYNVPVAINKYGFRDRKDLRMSKADDMFVVGDSFMFGYGVEEDKRFSNLVEEKLGIPVYNIAMPGDLDNQKNLIGYAQGTGATIHNLIIGVCMENNLRYFYQDNGQRHIHKTWFFNAFQDFKKFMGANLASYNIISYAIHHNRFLVKAGARTGLVADKEELGRINAPRGKDWNITISDSARKLKEISAPFNTTIIIIPSRALWIGEEREAESLFHNNFVKALKNLGLSVIDMRPYFEEGGNPLSYHFKNDGHWNEKGHQKAAEIFIRYYKNMIRSN